MTEFDKNKENQEEIKNINRSENLFFEEEEERQPINNNNNNKEEEIINFLNDDSHGAFFSISMSIQQDSVTSNPLDKKNNNPNNLNNQIFSHDIEEIVEESASYNNDSPIKKTNVKFETKDKTYKN